MRKAIIKTYLGILAVGLAYLLFVRLTGLSIPCFYRRVSGLLCPGCGCSRMFLALSRLDWKGAFAYHPVMFVLLFPWNLAALLGIWGKPEFLQKPKVWYWMLGVSIAAMLVFGIVRNFC